MYSTFPPLPNNTKNSTYPNDTNQILDSHYLARRAQQQQQQAAILASVEFTDLTNPVYADRRRRKSSTNQDKQAITNMGIVRFSFPLTSPTIPSPLFPPQVPYPLYPDPIPQHPLRNHSIPPFTKTPD